MLAAAREQSLEGVVAKQIESAYQPGARSRSWLKIKNLRTQEVLIAGWRPGQGRRADGIGSLLAIRDRRRAPLRREGRHRVHHRRPAGTETPARTVAAGHSPLGDGVPSADARGAHWVRPELVGEVRFTEWTRDGRLRHPAWRGLRPDKDPDQVVHEG